MAKTLKRTVLHGWHKEHGGQTIEFAGWEMPLVYDKGIISEHLATRRYGGLFDVSHMGRFFIRGGDAVSFLQHVLTNDVLALDPGMAQYTLIQNERGGAIDDAYLYRLEEDNVFLESSYVLVVNAANKDRDWDWLKEEKNRFKDVLIEDRSEEIGLLALQGPLTRGILERIVLESHSKLPDPWRNRLRVCEIEGEHVSVTISRTGYTGEPICFELFMAAEKLKMVWEKILAVGGPEGIVPVGLGARDTLRLEAGLPLYGHELGLDGEGKEIPIYAVSSAAQATSFSPLKGNFIGREALKKQFEEAKARVTRTPLPDKSERMLPKRIFPIAGIGQGIARQGFEVFAKGSPAGYVTSGTMVPYWVFSDAGILSKPTGESKMRSLALAYADADLEEGDRVEIQQRGKTIEGIVVERHLSGEAPPYSRPLGVQPRGARTPRLQRGLKDLTETLIEKAAENTRWRQRQAINLIPSEQTPSLLVRLLTIADPACRYAEHRAVKALGEREVFYYQGTKLIEEVESLLAEEFRQYLGCTDVEMRVISGQMANTTVFSGLMDYLNRVDRRSQPRRIRKVMNHHLGRGGHLSAQPMGALKDFIATDPTTERPAVIPFPVKKEDHYQIDLAKTEELLHVHKPELVVLGKSMVIYREPVKEIAEIASKIHPKPVIHYDMAHVLGLVGPCFQEPFLEGADLVTGSTHKTFFGPQRGVIGSNMGEGTVYEPLWQAIVRRVFPGSVSNHHLGTILGLLLAAYEMNAYKSEYQKAVVTHAKAFARSLKDHGISVEGDPGLGFTETHQVIVRVGYGKGPEMADRLEKSNIICNYQASPDDEGFTVSSCLRLGVQEMTRFGMEEDDFGQLAEYMSEVILRNRSVAEEVARFRGKFLEMKYCLPEKEASAFVERLWGAIR
jgi:aminomethyltransferase